MNKDDFEKLRQQAREANLVSYFQQSGYTVEQHGKEYYVKEIAGLCINPSENKWYSHYAGIGRINNSVDCLTQMCGMNFNQAVYALTGTDISATRSYDYPKEQQPQYTSPTMNFEKEKKRKELDVPPPCDNMRRVFAYLCKTRKIPPKIVEEFAHAGLLYQSQKTERYKGENALFVYRDKNNEIVGGELQGINSYKRFKGVCAGTNQDEHLFMFTPCPAKDGKIKRAYLFESAIDLMSFYSLCNKKNKMMEGATFISMAGLKPEVPKKLQAEGVQVLSCVDNDEKGKAFETENGFERPKGAVQYLDDNGFKDWNELIVFKDEFPNVNVLENQEQRKLSNLFRRGNS